VWLVTTVNSLNLFLTLFYCFPTLSSNVYVFLRLVSGRPHLNYGAIAVCVHWYFRLWMKVQVNLSSFLINWALIIHSFIRSSMALQPVVWPCTLLQFRNVFYTVRSTPWTSDQPVSRLLPAHRTTQTQNKRTQTTMSWVGLEPTIPAFERAKTVHALDPAATVIGK
jgi:hypothetical protein